MTVPSFEEIGDCPQFEEIGDCPQFPVSSFSVSFLTPTWLGRRSSSRFVAWEVLLRQTVGRHEGTATRATQLDVASIGEVGDQCKEGLAPMAYATPYPA